jgi:uncharacterized membrane protein
MIINRNQLVAWLPLLLSTVLCLGLLSYQLSAPSSQEFVRGTVVSTDNTEVPQSTGAPRFTQQVRAELPTGDQVTVAVGSEFQPLLANQLLKPGTRVSLTQTTGLVAEPTYVISDIDRTPLLILLAGGLILAVLLVAGFQGLGALVGMLVTVTVLVVWVVPQLLAGANPILICLSGCLVIGATSLYLSHGWNWKTHLGLVSIAVILLGVSLVAWISLYLGQIIGLTSQEAYFLQFGPSWNLNIQGLLLGGIMLGTLGILDDIVLSQISVVLQIKSANRSLSQTELYHRGLTVGRDHVASLVNTLVLAYAGANLPLFILFVSDDRLPWWVSLSNEVVAVEVVRTLIGSLGLVLAVPLATFLAAWWCQKVKAKTLKVEVARGH